MNKKLKWLCIALAVLSTYSYATCSKQEVMKLIDKGVSKDLINSICETPSKTTTTTAKPKSKWITPSNSTCRSKGGKLYKGVCDAKWQQAKNICRASGGRLPSKSELLSVISDCGGNTANSDSAHTENRDDPNYQSCYKRKGFVASSNYWSSTSYASSPSYAWTVYFYGGDTSYNGKNGSRYVRCVRAGQ